MKGMKLSAVKEPNTNAFDAYLFLMGVPALNAYKKGMMLLMSAIAGNIRNESEMMLPISDGNLTVDE
jgi:hypothetical protein